MGFKHVKEELAEHGLTLEIIGDEDNPKELIARDKARGERVILTPGEGIGGFRTGLHWGAREARLIEKQNAKRLAKMLWDAGLCNLVGRKTGDEPPGEGNLELVESTIAAALGN